VPEFIKHGRKSQDPLAGHDLPVSKYESDLLSHVCEKIDAVFLMPESIENAGRSGCAKDKF
jgi:hypothetical protein